MDSLQMALSGEERMRLAEAIDRLMTVDIMGRGFVEKAYPAARKLVDKPLVQEAGDHLIELFSGNCGRAVLICTGATTQRPGLADHIGEMDGPPGSIALARFLGKAFSALPVMVTDAGQGGMLAEACAASGLYNISFEDLVLQSEKMPYVSAVCVVELPDDDEKAAKIATDLVSKTDPLALIAVEKAGRNECGIYHNSQKRDTSNCKARVESLFDACEERGVYSIGVGDGGNEVGMGNIRDFLLEEFSHMRTCDCPCGGSILAMQKASCLIVAVISNWGAYGLITYMAAVTNNPYAGHSPSRERNLLRGCARAGYMHIDGYRVAAADGLPEDLHAAFVALLSCMGHWPPLKHARAGILDDMLAK